MTRNCKKLRAMWVAGVLFCSLTAGNLLAGERTGNLVFEAMKKMEDAHKVFLGDVKQIRAEHAAAVAQRDAVKESFRKAKSNSIDRQEFHARFCLSQARVLNALRKETDLTHQVTANQLKILNKLYNSIESGRGAATPQGIKAILRAAKPVLIDGRKLLASLGNYSDKITDPVINSRLNAATGTAKMLSNYTANLEKGLSGNLVTQEELKRRLADLIQQLNAVFAQTDILGAMIRDKAAVLKMINELAATETFFSILSGGKGIVSDLSEGVMAPLIEAVDESDQDLDLLMDGVYHDVPETGSGSSQRWIESY